MAKKKTFADLMADAALQGMPEDKTTADLLNVPLSRGAILPLTEYLDRAEFDLSSGLPGAFADAVTAPARAARGEISEAEQIPEAFNFAGSLTLGSLLAPRPTGSVGMGGRAAKALEAQQPQGIRAFHGSPHDFDRFSMDAIGTGEGAQAYGHGLYFAEAEDVARSYRNQLGKFGDKFGPKENAWDLVNRYGQDPKTLADQMDAIPDKSQMMVDTIQALRDGTYKNINAPGHMYEVNIKADPQDFLDWDKPLSQQSEQVRQLVQPRLDQLRGAGAKFSNDLYGKSIWKAFNPQNGLDQFNWDIGPAAQGAQALREAGIPGMRYLDQMSRGAGEGSYNYVIFDDAIIDIVKKYGIAGLALLQAAGYGTNEGEETQ